MLSLMKENAKNRVFQALRRSRTQENTRDECFYIMASSMWNGSRDQNPLRGFVHTRSCFCAVNMSIQFIEHRDTRSSSI